MPQTDLTSVPLARSYSSFSCSQVFGCHSRANRFILVRIRIGPEKYHQIIPKQGSSIFMTHLRALLLVIRYQLFFRPWQSAGLEKGNK